MARGLSPGPPDGVRRAPEFSNEAHSSGIGCRWIFLSNHAHVRICLALDPRQRLREVADQIGIAERAVQGIVSDLESAWVLRRHRKGRCKV